MKRIHKINENIYITNDSEIKEGDWVYSIWDKKIKRAIKDIKDALFLKKIILTTDQDLIADGVQPIDDEFLEWFVKNPSCEKVEVKCYSKFNDGDFTDYKIIIPKEELERGITITHIGKQETLEEVAENLGKTNWHYGNLIKWFEQFKKK
jgi:hypothetical protein